MPPRASEEPVLAFAVRFDGRAKAGAQQVGGRAEGALPRSGPSRIHDLLLAHLTLCLTFEERQRTGGL